MNQSFVDTIPDERSSAPRIPRKISPFGAGGLLLMATSAVAVCAWLAVFLQWVFA
jgi:hypothetical protein